MAIVTQYGGNQYDADNYPFVLLNKTRDWVEGRFSTLKKAHDGRLLTALNNPEDLLLLYNEKTKTFIDWLPKDLRDFERAKNNPKYSDKIFKRLG